MFLFFKPEFIVFKKLMVELHFRGLIYCFFLSKSPLSFYS